MFTRSTADTYGDAVTVKETDDGTPVVVLMVADRTATDDIANVANLKPLDALAVARHLVKCAEKILAAEARNG